jgi:hypothetical protein
LNSVGEETAVEAVTEEMTETEEAPRTASTAANLVISPETAEPREDQEADLESKNRALSNPVTAEEVEETTTETEETAVTEEEMTPETREEMTLETEEEMTQETEREE